MAAFGKTLRPSPDCGLHRNAPRHRRRFAASLSHYFAAVNGFTSRKKRRPLTAAPDSRQEAAKLKSGKQRCAYANETNSRAAKNARPIPKLICHGVMTVLTAPRYARYSTIVAPLNRARYTKTMRLKLPWHLSNSAAASPASAEKSAGPSSPETKQERTRGTGQSPSTPSRRRKATSERSSETGPLAGQHSHPLNATSGTRKQHSNKESTASAKSTPRAAGSTTSKSSTRQPKQASRHPRHRQ